MRRKSIVAGVLVAALSGCAVTKTGYQPPSQILPYELGEIAPVTLFDNMLLAGQPSPEDFEEAKEAGIVTVLNMRLESETPDLDERAVVERLGMEYLTLPWSGPDQLTDDVFRRSRILFATVEQPALIHCGSANRIGAVWIPWRVLDGGIPLEKAVVEAKQIGLRTPAYEEKAISYVERVKAGEVL
ncbi:MAG: protein tyrosine phosphatase family protein [Planctomycetota bacterium]